MGAVDKFNQISAIFSYHLLHVTTIKLKSSPNLVFSVELDKIKVKRKKKESKSGKKSTDRKNKDERDSIRISLKIVD